MFTPSMIFLGGFVLGASTLAVFASACITHMNRELMTLKSMLDEAYANDGRDPRTGRYTGKPRGWRSVRNKKPLG